MTNMLIVKHLKLKSGDTLTGGKLKATGTLEAGTGLWLTPNTGASNSSGFNALPGGFRKYSGAFMKLNNSDYWWVATDVDPDFAWAFASGYNSADTFFGTYTKTNGYSVRCIKD